VTKQPILNKFDKIKEKEKKVAKERPRKIQPKRRNWVDGHVTEINDWNPFELKEEILNLENMKHEINLVKNEKQEKPDMNSAGNKINLSFVKRPERPERTESSESKRKQNSHSEKRIFAKKTVKKNNTTSKIDYSNIFSENNHTSNDLHSFSDLDLNNLKNGTVSSQVNDFIKEKDMGEGRSANIEEDYLEPSKCFICNWTYPKDMDIQEKNAHMNHCIEGRGESHRRNYLDNLRFIAKSKKLNDNSVPPGKKLFKSNSGNLKEFKNTKYN
jgi:hypothetical protein